jgi:hypothetical protein
MNLDLKFIDFFNKEHIVQELVLIHDVKYGSN